MPTVDFVATQSHWQDHLAPVWHALDPSERGRFYARADSLDHARGLDIDAEPFPEWPKLSRTIVVAADGDRNRARDRRVVLFQHGVGFSFHGARGPAIPDLRERPPNLANSSYAGGRRQDNVVLFLNPNRYAHDRWIEAYPNKASEVIGMPKMDRWHNGRRKRTAATPTVALTWHWNSMVCAETRWAFPHYRNGMAEFVEQMDDVKLIAHAHPRSVAQLEPFFTGLGVEWVPDLNEVYRRAHVLVNDSSSVLYEFASLDRPVVVLNAPWFRRSVEHGLRFWQHADVGVQVDRIQDLPDGIRRAIADPPEQQALRRAANDDVFPVRGCASERAADAIRKVSQ